MSDFCRGLRGLEKDDGRHGTVECPDAGNTGKDGTFEMAYMSRLEGPSNRRWRTVAGTVLLSARRMLEAHAITALNMLDG